MLCAQPVSADSCRFSATRIATIDGGPFRKVIVGAGAGHLLIQGDKTLGGDQQAHLDLTVDLPETMATEIEDSSGGAEIRGIGSSVITDSSGELRISDIHGDLSVTDSSGGTYITTVTGNARIEDSSGEMEVVGVTGNLTVPIDSSGAPIRIRKAERLHLRDPNMHHLA